VLQVPVTFSNIADWVRKAATAINGLIDIFGNGPLAVSDGGTGATTTAGALANLGLTRVAMQANGTGSNVSLSAGTFTKVNFAASIDTASTFSSSRWKPPAGTYRVSWQVSFSTPAATNIYAALFKNGSGVAQGVVSAPASGTQTAGSSLIVSMNGTDYLEVFALSFAPSTVIESSVETLFGAEAL